MVIILTLPNLAKLGVLIHYKINKNYIAQEHCIYKDQVENTCQGKCYLKDQLAQTETKTEGSSPIPYLESREVLLFYTSPLPLHFIKKPINFQSNWQKHQNQLYSSFFIEDIFHPPEVIVV